MAKELRRYFDAVMQSVEDQLDRACWKPAADVYRAPGGWLVKLDAAGVSPEDVKIEVAGRRLTVSGYRRDQLATQGLTHHRLEISYNSFQRTLELPESIENAQLEMEMDQGMLIVRIVKGVSP